MATDSKIVTRTLVLTGGREGMSCTVGKQYKFVDGKMVLKGPVHQIEQLTHWLGVNYQAFPEGSDEVEAQNGVSVDSPEALDGQTPEVLSDVQPGGEGSAPEEADNGEAADGVAPDSAGHIPEGDGHGDARVQRIQEALTGLDVTNDEHWVNDGKPSVAAVSTLMNEQVSRAEIDAAAPDFSR